MINGTFKFDVEGKDEEQLHETLELLILLTKSKIAAYKIDQEKQQFILYSYDNEPESVPFYGATRVETVSHMIWDWLKDSRTRDAFKALHKEPDIDGSTSLGWHVTAPYHSYQDSYSVLAKISCTWFEYHK